jgi:hypothetical protein
MSSDPSNEPLFPPYQCRDCGSGVGFRSRRRTFIERYLLPMLFLQPVRCGECFRRDYRLMLTPVRPRLSGAAKPKKMPEKESAKSGRNVA